MSTIVTGITIREVAAAPVPGSRTCRASATPIAVGQRLISSAKRCLGLGDEAALVAADDVAADGDAGAGRSRGR